MVALLPGQIPQWEEYRRSLSVGLLLRDAVTRRDRLFGEVSVGFAGLPIEPFQKQPEAAYFFHGIAPGAYTLEVRSSADTPYYQPVDIPIVVPMPEPLWPAFPNHLLADQSLALGDPGQPAAFRAQRQAATLQPTTAYPFPAQATLARGTVRTGGNPLAGARVRLLAGSLDYTTGDDGEYVLFFTQISGVGETVILRASHPNHANVDVHVDVRRAATVARSITMV